jgi:hypothetical protein
MFASNVSGPSAVGNNVSQNESNVSGCAAFCDDRRPIFLFFPKRLGLLQDAPAVKSRSVDNKIMTISGAAQILRVPAFLIWREGFPFLALVDVYLSEKQGRRPPQQSRLFRDLEGQLLSLSARRHLKAVAARTKAQGKTNKQQRSHRFSTGF